MVRGVREPPVAVDSAGDRTRAIAVGHLVDVGPADRDWVAAALPEWDSTERWSGWRNQTPSPYKLTQLLWQGVEFQRVALSIRGTTLGLFQLTNTDLEDGHASLEMLMRPGHGEELNGLLERFLTEGFSELRLRKVILASTTSDLVLPPYIAANAHLAGSLRAHRRLSARRYADVNLHELWAQAVST